MKWRNWTKSAVAVLTALALSAAVAADTGPLVTSPAATNAVPATQIEPPRMELPPDLAEVVRMAQAGISDDVLVTYIQQSPTAYSPTADQVVYLRDLGISPAVLQALIDHQAASPGATAESSTPSPTAASTTETNAVVEAPASMPPAANYYYDSLAPYGTWLYLPAYGWCWQPSVVVINSGWQPYCNDGCWLWTDCGWYWNSYYSWGWAPFHYGRWCQYPRYGWVWCPDRTWGPAWVCWRSSAAYCGWAPLPPGALYRVGVGWTFNGVSVGLNFGFGLGPACFTFCDYNHFCDRHPDHHFQYGHDADRFFHETQVHNDWTTDEHHHLFNRGIDPQRVEAATHAPLPEVAVRELPRGGGRFTMPGRLERAGNAMVVYRTGANDPAPRNPFIPAPGRRVPGPGERHAFGSTRTYGGETRTSPEANQSSPQRSGLAPDRSRQFHLPTWGANGTRQTRFANPSPSGQWVQPVRHYAPPRTGQSFSWNNPHARASVGPRQTTAPSRSAVQSSAPSRSRSQTYVAPRQYTWHPAGSPPSSVRPAPYSGAARGGNYPGAGNGQFRR